MTKSESSTPGLGNLAPFSSCMAMFSYGNASKRWGVVHGVSSWYICILKLVMIVLIDLPKAQQSLLVNNYPGLSIRGLPTLSLGDLIRRMYGSQKIICRTILKSKAEAFFGSKSSSSSGLGTVLSWNWGWSHKTHQSIRSLQYRK